MTWTSSDSNGNASLSELRKNAILDVRTIQELFGLEFPYPGTLLNSPKHDPWYALQLSIQHQFHELPLLYGNAVLRNLRDLCHFLGRTCDGFSESPILDQMSAVANFFFRLCGYQRRLAIVEPSSELGLIASVPHEVHTVGDFRHMPVVWVYYDDRAGDEPGNVIFAGMCNPNSVYSPSYNGGLTNRTAPPVCTHTEDLAQDDDLISSISVSGSDSEDDGSVSVISASADILEESGATNPPQPISHTPPPNAPTGPASLCWNCGGRGHRSIFSVKPTKTSY
ncbi:hypothetical protein N0V93_004961 [Gnomoniopsis smithogilvyi]|uniref:Uncharacterized protein n=1 Tax=Gnomoniopsis smithogilvyi TaxID=1191159 RepID=A0A9W8YSE4_9PEZI|nr:hypothetical protein N0V93_004961 [Gnomoniopsis smithogilvyi]